MSALDISTPPLPATKVKTLYTVDDGVLRLHFHEGQARAWASKTRHTLVSAGTQGGKTSFGPWWLYREIYGMGNFIGRGDGDYLAVTTNFDLFKLKMLPELRTVFEDVLGVGKWWAGDRVMELRNPYTGLFADTGKKFWGRIILRSAEAPSGLEASTAKAAWLDEAGQDEWDVTIWEAVKRRLALNQGRSLLTTTVYNTGWLKTEFYDRWVNNDPVYGVVQFASVKNPAFPMDEFEEARRSLPKWRFDMFYLGKFAKPAGLIYEDFEDEWFIDPIEIKPHWPITVGVDFGGVNNATVFVAENTDVNPSIYYVFAEYLEGKKPISDTVSSTRQRIGAMQYVAKVGTQEKTMSRRVTIVGGAPSEDAWRMEWAQAGLYVHRPPVGDVEVGILAVTKIIRNKRLRVFKTCVGLRHEIGTYRRQVAADGEVSDTIVNKATFHRLDGLRYVFVTGTSPQLF